MNLGNKETFTNYDYTILCPICNTKMVLKIARKGKTRGKSFRVVLIFLNVASIFILLIGVHINKAKTLEKVRQCPPYILNNENAFTTLRPIRLPSRCDRSASRKAMRFIRVVIADFGYRWRSGSGWKSIAGL